MRILRARLLAAAQEEADAEASEARRSQVRTVDRSERIRTYNFPENRISDHRTGYKAYNLDQVLDGDLEPGPRLLRRGRPRRPASRRSSTERAAPTDAVGCVAAAAAGCARPGSPAPSTTRPSCSPTCSGTQRGRLVLVDEVAGDRRRRRTTRWSTAGRPASRCST